MSHLIFCVALKNDDAFINGENTVKGNKSLGKNHQPKVKSLYKALKLLDYFDEEHKELGVTEIAEMSGIIKSSVHNILQTFECCGFVTQIYGSNKYRIGSAALELFEKYRTSHHIDYRVSESLQEIRNKYHVNVYLGMRNEFEVIYICAEVETKNSGNLHKIGAKTPLHCVGLGKILLGYSEVDIREAFYKTELQRFTPYTICDQEVLRKEVEDAVYLGYAKSNSEYVIGMNSVAVPIIVGYEPIKYALGVSSNEPFSDFDLKKVLAELREKSKIIASLLNE
ncbi:IclR family transcriptional regulator [Acetivibrio cellulolyticus]|uniref:IclR family transcriptional regulator n=1 Tax=Acetivibrio cellulolyticus TaxID=35830 RepID=UPI0001E2E6FD|nr:IclR family transcriptional regulator [Acetivibrio cellulolyticus]